MQVVTYSGANCIGTSNMQTQLFHFTLKNKTENSGTLSITNLSKFAGEIAEATYDVTTDDKDLLLSPQTIYYFDQSLNEVKGQGSFSQESYSK